MKSLPSCETLYVWLAREFTKGVAITLTSLWTRAWGVLPACLLSVLEIKARPKIYLRSSRTVIWICSFGAYIVIIWCRLRIFILFRCASISSTYPCKVGESANAALIFCKLVSSINYALVSGRPHIQIDTPWSLIWEGLNKCLYLHCSSSSKGLPLGRIYSHRLYRNGRYF